MGCCGNSKFVKYIWILIGLVLLAAVIFSLTSCSGKRASESQELKAESQIDYYTCGMHPSVRVSPQEYDKGQVNCPICNMKLIPVYQEGAEKEAEVYYGCGMEGEEHVFLIKGKPMEKCPICGMPLVKLSKEEADKLRGVVSRVKIKGEQTRLAGVKTKAVRKHHLYKEIRTVGRIAYDPELVIAEEEFISTLKTLDKIQEGRISEIKERAYHLAESSKRKLKLLGLSKVQIEELQKTRQIHTSYILPEEKMWIYGDIYEYELSWIKVGQKIKVATASFPGEEFSGIISSINPVLDSKTRSVIFRAEIDNPDLKLKPEMFVDIIINSMYMSPNGEHMVLAVPRNAVLDTGVRKIVWIDKGEGEFEGRIVDIGPESVTTIEGMELKFYPVLGGLREGELVVTKANFLIDSQSQITGVAAAAYGGALGKEEKKAPPIHQH